MQDIYGVPHPITASVYHVMLGLGWLAFILSIVCNLLFYAVHPAQVQMGGVGDKISKMPWKIKKDEEKPVLEEKDEEEGEKRNENREGKTRRTTKMVEEKSS